MKILVLAEALDINKTSEAICTNKFLIALQEGGHDTCCITSEKIDITNYPWLNNVQNWNYTPWSLNKIIDYTLVTIDKLLNSKLQKLSHYFNGFSFRYWHDVKCWQYSITKAISLFQPDLIIARGRGASFRTHTAMFYLNTHIKWVANFHDPFPFSQYPAPYQYKPVGYKKQEKMNSKIINKANYITVPSLRLKEWMQQFNPEMHAKTYVLPHVNINWGIYRKIEIIKQNKKNLTFVHAGSLLGERNPESFISAFKILSTCKKSINIYFNLLGNIGGENTKELISNDENIKIINNRHPYFETLDILNLADALLIIEADGIHSPFLPGKFIDSLYLKKPVIILTNSNSELSRLLKGYPYLSNVKDMDKIIEILFDICDRWENDIPYPKMPDEIYKYFSVSFMKQAIDKILAT